ncbi:MAG TPA: hypothetical protein VIM79_11775 [Niastella sp.]
MLKRLIAKIKRDIGLQIILIGLLSLMFFPWLLTRSFGVFHFNDSTGVIGDTIGGITGPISGFLGAVLVYLALKEQIKANNLIYNQFEEQKKDDSYKKTLLYVTESIKMLREDIKDFEIVTEKLTKASQYQLPKKETVIYRGVEAIANALDIYSTDIGHDKNVELKFNAHLVQIRNFLDNTLYIIDKINSLNIEREDRKHLLMVVLDTYTSKLYPFLKQYEKQRTGKIEPCKFCQKKHSGIPEYIYELYDSINKEIKNIASSNE